MLIESYNLSIEASRHSADEFEFEAIAYLPVDIAPVLAYLNATLKNGTYLADGPVFSWRQGAHKIAFWPDRIAVDHLESREEGLEIIEKLVRMVNEVWEKRGAIEPDTSTRENLQPLEIFRLLPRTNCKECDESSCFAFALKLAAGQVDAGKCRPLYANGGYQERRAQLEALLETKRTLL